MATKGGQTDELRYLIDRLQHTLENCHLKGATECKSENKNLKKNVPFTDPTATGENLLTFPVSDHLDFDLFNDENLSNLRSSTPKSKSTFFKCKYQDVGSKTAN